MIPIPSFMIDTQVPWQRNMAEGRENEKVWVWESKGQDLEVQRTRLRDVVPNKEFSRETGKKSSGQEGPGHCGPLMLWGV